MTQEPVSRFSRSKRVPFSACDPAGIVFFAQYHVMFQDLVDDWVTERLGIPYAELLGPRRIGLPTVRFETDFRAISRMGDAITLALEVEHLGTSSFVLRFTVSGRDGAGREELRAKARQVIVCTSLDTHKSTPLPDDLRAAILTFMHDAAPEPR